MKKIAFLSLFLGALWAEMSPDSANTDSHSSTNLPIDFNANSRATIDDLPPPTS